MTGQDRPPAPWPRGQGVATASTGAGSAPDQGKVPRTSTIGPRAGGATTLQACTVLIVGDSELAREVERTLSLDGITSTSCSTPIGVTRAIGERTFGGVIVDVGNTPWTASRMVAAIAAAARPKGLPLLLVGAGDSASLEALGDNHGCIGVAREFIGSALVPTLRFAMQRRAAGDPDEHTRDDECTISMDAERPATPHRQVTETTLGWALNRAQQYVDLAGRGKAMFRRHAPAAALVFEVPEPLFAPRRQAKTHKLVAPPAAARPRESRPADRPSEVRIYAVERRASAEQSDRITAGRTANNDIVIVEGSVSRSHLYFERRRTIWLATDVGSSNGTYIDDKRLIPRKARPLRCGSRLRMGDVEARFLMRDGLFDYLTSTPRPDRENP